MLRAALDVADAVLPQELLEGRLAAPRGVLPAVVGQHLARHAVGRDAALERLDDERRLVVVREHVRDDEARVVVEERRHVELLVPPKPELEDVRLPHLVRLGPLEAALRRRPLGYARRLFRQQPFVVQDAAHLRRRHSERLEALETVGDFPRAEVRERLLHCDDRVPCRSGHRPLRLRTRLRDAEPRVTQLAVLLQPGRHGLVGDAEHPRHRVRREVFLEHALHDAQPELRCIATTIRVTRLPPTGSAFVFHCRSSSR